MKNTIDLKIYNDFDADFMNEWQKLYVLLKGNYNLSPAWCRTWFKHFGGKDKKLSVFTVWEDDVLKSVAPFYLKNKTLFLVGSKPDFYDAFDILSASEDYTEKIAEDILNRKLNVDFRLADTESKFVKFFLKKLENEKAFSKKIYYSSLKTKADTDFKFSKSFSHRIKRKITSSNNKFNQKLVFDFETEKNSGDFEQMLILHKNRWPLFRAKDKELFIKDLYYNTDLLSVVRLSHENTENAVSYQLVYKYFDRISISASAFDPQYEVISPTLLAHYYLFNEAFERQYSVVDFGTGAQPYKDNFTNSESVVFSMKTSSSVLKKYDFIYSPLKMLKSKCASFLT